MTKGVKSASKGARSKSKGNTSSKGSNMGGPKSNAQSSATGDNNFLDDPNEDSNEDIFASG